MACLERLPPAPKRLEGDARKAWKVHGRRLMDAGLLTELDLDLLADLCVIEARLAQAEANVKSYGLVLITESGSMYQNPYLAVANRAMEQIAAIRAQFGMGPANRARVRAAPLPAVPDEKGKGRFFGRAVG